MRVGLQPMDVRPAQNGSPALPGRHRPAPAGNADGVSRGRLIGIEAINGDGAVVHELRQFGRVVRAAPPEEDAAQGSVSAATPLNPKPPASAEGHLFVKCGGRLSGGPDLS